MLRILDIRDVLIIDRLTLDFASGLNVLTGETGAGKSILLDALGFVLGWRGRAELVRAGAAQGEVTAEFDLSADHPARAVLAEQQHRVLPIGLEFEILKSLEIVDIQTLQHAVTTPVSFEADYRARECIRACIRAGREPHA